MTSSTNQSSLYFIAAAISQISEIVLVNDIHMDAPTDVVSYQIPELVMDVVLLSWIYLALTSTIRILTEFKQSHKLSMYRWLTGTIYIFVFLFSCVTVVLFMNKLGYITWPWKWAWAQQILWEILNFSILTCVCAICRPTDTSKLLAYASQLPTEDPDEDGDDETGNYELSGMGGDNDFYEEDENDEEEGDFVDHTRQQTQRKFSLNNRNVIDDFDKIDEYGLEA